MTVQDDPGRFSSRLRIYNKNYGILSIISSILIFMFLINDLGGIIILATLTSKCFGAKCTNCPSESLITKDPLSFATFMFTLILLLITLLLTVFLVVMTLKNTRPGEEISTNRRRYHSLWFSDVIFLVREPHLFVSYILISTLLIILFNGSFVVAYPRYIIGREKCPPQLSEEISNFAQLLALLIDVTLGIGLPLMLNQLLPVFFHSKRELLTWHEGKAIEEALAQREDHVVIVGFGKLGEITTRLFLAWRPLNPNVLSTRYRIAPEYGKSHVSPPWYLTPYLGGLVVVDKEIIGPYRKEFGEDFSVGIEDVDIIAGERDEFIGARGDISKEIVQEMLNVRSASLIINTAGEEETHRILEEITMLERDLNLITRVYNINWPGASKKWTGTLKVDSNRDGVLFVLGRKMQYLLSDDYVRGIYESLVT